MVDWLFCVAKNKRAGNFTSAFDVVKIAAPLHMVDEQGERPQKGLKQILDENRPEKGGSGSRAG